MSGDRLRRALCGGGGLSFGIGVITFALLLLSACAGQESTGTVRGLVVDVVGRGIAEIESLGIRAEDGKTWTFTSEGPLRFSASHLREHQLFGHEVTVSYTRKGDSLVAVDLSD